MKVFLFAALLISSAVAASVKASDSRIWGHSEQDSHVVSAIELIGRPEFFNGQPVSAVGVAQFRRDDDADFHLYASTEDLRNSTPAAIKIGGFSKSLKISDEDLASLNGRIVTIEGTFHMLGRPKLKPGKKKNFICLWDCAVPGQIKDIVTITVWPPK